MSSPVHHPDDLDAALRYAPPWARNDARTWTRQSNAPGVTPPSDRAAESDPTGPYDDDYGPQFDGDRAMLALQHQLSLDPAEMPEPPVRIDRRSTLDRIAFRLCAVAGIAALVAWVTIAVPINISLPISFSLPIKPHIEDIAHVAVAPALTATPVKLVHIRTAIAPLPAVSNAPVARAPAPVPVRVAEATPAVPAAVPLRVAEAMPKARGETSAPAPAADPPRPAAQPVRLTADEIAMLVNRGKEFLASGDVSSARLLLRRAADAGNAEGALALGSTFDPVVIARLGAIGVEADAAKARQWYEKAAALGSNLASDQIAKLAEAGR